MRQQHGGRKPRITKTECLQEAVRLCNKGGLISITDVIAFLPINKSVFYRMFPSGSTELKMIQDALEVSKRRACVSIRGRLYEMKKNVMAQLAVYKMLCTEEERAALSFSKTDISSNGKEIQSDPIVIEVIDSCDKVENKE